MKKIKDYFTFKSLLVGLSVFLIYIPWYLLFIFIGVPLVMSILMSFGCLVLTGIVLLYLSYLITTDDDR